ncbi:MAG: hypothetical protein FWH07_05450 [Oscillospiraceae bacterium]|nr:hypothetical protein [Oscillospiraceae bacterium]
MREILLNICITAIALCLFKMLLPENAMKKQANFLIACFFLASMVFFFTTGKLEFAGGDDFTAVFSDSDDNDNAFIDFEQAYAHAQTRAIERETRSKLTEILAKEKLFFEEIYTSINISDKYSISINEIRLVLDLEHENSRAINQEEDAEENEFVENEPNDESLEILKKAMQIIQKEVGDKILITGEFKSDSV